MKLIKRSLIATTALGLSMAPAFAGENNDAFLDQTGTGNSAAITQSGNNNKAGDSSRRVLQDGDDNTISILQRNGASVGTGGNYAQNNRGVDQLGNRNVIEVDQTYGSGIYEIQQDSTGAGGTPTLTTNSVDVTQSGNMRVNRIVQTYTGDGTTEAGNSVTVSQTGSQFQNSFIGNSNGLQFANQGLFQTGAGNSMDVRQVGPGHKLILGEQIGQGNSADVDQTGSGNRIDTISQNSTTGASGNSAVVSLAGSYNGVGGFTAGGAAEAAGAGASSVTQIGGGNSVDYMVSGANDNQFGFYQDGNDNLAVNITVSGNANELGIYQEGDRNELVLGAIAGMGNNVGLIQGGNDNTASLTIAGSFNGGANAFGANVAGDLGLTAGLMHQVGDDNAITHDVLGDNNVFAFKQDTLGGAGNTIIGSQNNTGGAGNQVAVLQMGGGNMASFSQMGGGNVAGISQ